MFLAVEVIATGRLKTDESDILVERLTNDLAEYPERWVINAIKKHRKASPFFPALSDIVKHMQFMIDLRSGRLSGKPR